MGFMRFNFFLLVTLFMVSSSVFASDRIRIATFNVSMDASNYVEYEQLPSVTSSPVPQQLRNGNEQIAGIAEILQRVRPDIVLLNEFDYVDRERGIDVFLRDYLAASQNGLEPIEYPHVYTAPVNTGVPSPFDLNRDGKASGRRNDAWGFGWYPGQYGMVILSKYPLAPEQARTFQHFLWQDMPGHHVPMVPDSEGQLTDQPWYSDEVMAQFPLSSKSHWDVPVIIGDKVIHLLAAHPTPPSFDGPENRNGMKNYDEIRLLRDYISPGADNYIYDDSGKRGGLADDAAFVVLGDLNAGPGRGGVDGAIEQLLTHPRVNDVQPMSKGGKRHSPDADGAEYHTAAWRNRVDYVLPSSDLIVEDAGVFWPVKGQQGYRLMAERGASSDHRLVWIDITL